MLVVALRFCVCFCIEEKHIFLTPREREGEGDARRENAIKIESIAGEVDGSHSATAQHDLITPIRLLTLDATEPATAKERVREKRWRWRHVSPAGPGGSVSCLASASVAPARRRW